MVCVNDPDVDLDNGHRRKKRYNPKRRHWILKEHRTVFVTLRGKIITLRLTVAYLEKGFHLLLVGLQVAC